MYACVCVCVTLTLLTHARARTRGRTQRTCHILFLSRYKVKEREDMQSEMMALALHYYPPAEVLGASEILYRGD